MKNSEEFVEEIRDIELNEEDTMLRFDVVSLFTKVPVDEALEVIGQFSAMTRENDFRD